MEPATRRGLFIALLIAAFGLAACVVRTAPNHSHRSRGIHGENHEKHKKNKKPKKHKKHKKH